MAFGKRRPVRSQNLRHVRKCRRLKAERISHLHLARSVGYMVVTADNVRNAEIDIVND